MGLVQIPHPRRHQLQGADHLLLVVERGTDEVPDTTLDQLLLDRRPVRVVHQVVDDDRAILEHRPLVDRPGELGRRVVGGIGEDARLLVARRVIQDEHPVALHRSEAEAQIGPPEERPELRLKSLEVGVRHDRVLVDQVALEGGQDLLVGDVHRLHDHETAEHEALRGQKLAEIVTVDAAGLQPPPRRIRQRRLGTADLDLHEAPVELQPEVLIQPGGGIDGGEDHGNVGPQIDAVYALEDQLVGEQEPRGGQRSDAVRLQEARPALE